MNEYAAALQDAKLDRLCALYGAMGKPVRLAGVEGVGIYTTIQNRPDLLKGGAMRSGLICTARLKKTDWPDYTGFSSFKEKTVELMADEEWIKFTVRGVNASDLGGEWVLHLENIP